MLHSRCKFFWSVVTRKSFSEVQIGHHTVAELHREYAATLTAAVVRRFALSRNEAEDIVQECFVALLSSSGEIASPKGWLFRAAANLSFDRHLERQRTVQHDFIDAVSEEDSKYPDLRVILWQLTAALPPRRRAMLRMRYVEGWSAPEIAEFFGLKSGHVRQELYRTLVKLRRDLESEIRPVPDVA